MKISEIKHKGWKRLAEYYRDLPESEEWRKFKDKKEELIFAFSWSEDKFGRYWSEINDFLPDTPAYEYPELPEAAKKLLERIEAEDKGKDANQKLPVSLMLNEVQEWIETQRQEAWDKMGDTGNHDYTTEKMNYNEENYWFGYYRALENFEWNFLEDKTVK